MNNSESNSEHSSNSSEAKDSEQKASEQSSEATGPQDRDESRSVAEKVSFFLSSVLLLAVLGGTVYLWVRDRNSDPPVLEVSSRLEQRRGKYYVPFTVINQGEETATEIQVIAELRINGELVEWGDQRIDFLSRQEEAEGAFIFVRDPKAGELTVRVASYVMP